METRILGIVGNILYIEEFYAGDHFHQLYIPEHELDAFINSGRIPIYDNIDYIHCQTHGMTYDQYMLYLEQYNKEY